MVAPGTIILLSWFVSSVARAMMSPTRWRSWNDWLLPSRLAYSSSRESAAILAATCSADRLPVSIQMPSVTRNPRIVSAIHSRPFSEVGWTISSAARPIISGAPANTSQARVKHDIVISAFSL
jgi:hypothetical protein